MRYEVLIMLVVVGAVNLIGRVLAKRAEARAKAEAQAESAAPAKPAPPVVHRASAAKAPARAAARAVSKKKSEGTAPTAKPAPASPPVASASSGAARRAAAPAPAPSAAVTSGPDRAPRKRWNARSLRRAFVASEILGSPVSQRS